MEIFPYLFSEDNSGSQVTNVFFFFVAKNLLVEKNVVVSSVVEL